MTDIQTNTTITKVEAKTKKKFYKKWWVWVLVIVIIGIAAPKDSTEQSTGSKSQASATTNTDAPAQEKVAAETKAPEASVPVEYKSALSKGTSYANNMHMSKQGVYDQLTSEYGEKFSSESAQYAIDNIKADWSANALAKAKSYQERQSMSLAAIRDQLVSEYGEKFLPAEADYAIQHLNN